MIRWSTEKVTGENCLKYDSHINAWDWNSVPGYGLILANQPRRCEPYVPCLGA
jgi:hypothetical protein